MCCSRTDSGDEGGEAAGDVGGGDRVQGGVVGSNIPKRPESQLAQHDGANEQC